MSMCGAYLRVTSAELERVKQDPESVVKLFFPDDERDADGATHLDVDKAWHAIQFLLTDDPWSGEPPLQNVVMGGTELGEDLGYGPARYLVPGEVHEVATALGHITGEALWSRFSATKFATAEIYPQGWIGSNEERDYVVERYEQLREFFREAASAGDAMLLCLS
jgi:Domain of unknown function (DUF1877)